MIFYGDIVGDCEDFWIVTGIYFLIFFLFNFSWWQVSCFRGWLWGGCPHCGGFLRNSPLDVVIARRAVCQA